MTDAYDGDFDDEPDETVRRHPALDQLDEWEDEAETAVMADLAGAKPRSMSDLDILIGEKLVELHGDDIRELIEKLEQDRAMLQASIDSDKAQGNQPRQEDLDELESLDDAIEELKDALDV
jgi:hypothetical protein